MTVKDKKINYALKVLKKAFDANTNAHLLSEKSQNCYYNGDHDGAADYSCQKAKFYCIKSNIIEYVIKYIKKYSLPIKYGMNDGVIYFSYNGEQISFHSFRKEKKSGYDWDRHPKISSKLKKYKGNWKGVKNLEFPKALVIN